MVIRKITSFDRLKSQIDTIGQFSGIACYNEVSLQGREVLDYIYDELKYLKDHDLFNGSGRLMELNFDFSRILIRTMHKVGSARIKSFHIDQQEKAEILNFLNMIPNTYTTLRIVSEFRYFPKNSKDVSYFIEYNNS